MATARRGDKLHEHILWVAKDVFLEMGFERASMDVVAARAETSKRSLYAHFESKEKLFLAVIELVRGLVLERLGQPGDYAPTPKEAVALFCGRHLEILLYEPTIQMCRISMAETARFPEGAALYYDVTFNEAQARLADYMGRSFGGAPTHHAQMAERIVGRLVHPRFMRALFGIGAVIGRFEDSASVVEAELPAIRAMVDEIIGPLAG